MRLLTKYMKFNKSIAELDIPLEYKKYVDNYIKESIKLMHNQGYIEEFIYTTKSSNRGITAYGARVIIELIKNNIITFGYYNASGICVPIHKNAHLEVDPPLLSVYMLHDDVLLANGFVNPIVYKEEEKVA